ncbi:MAG: hypothetical protein H6660_08275 [Ardenticatenaceae bacterium]|nr:hypothetical protein [Ardenticatenaceae bacterium]
MVTLDYTPWRLRPYPSLVSQVAARSAVLDPYRLTIPAELPPGQYLIEVGLYEMVGKRRLHISDAQGNLVGDRYILGSVIVETDQ